LREELVALAKLAAMDDSARDIETELKEIPRRLEELRTGVDTLERLLAQERQQLIEAENLKVRQTEALKERAEGLQRARKKVAQAQRIKEAEAAEREVSANRRVIREGEEELGRIGAAIEAKKSSLTEREKDFEEAKTVLASEEESSKTRVSELKQQRDAMLAGRDELVGKISSRVVRTYERLRTGFPNVVILVEDATCPACRMALPAQLSIELRRAEELHQCPHCRRIIIDKETVAD
jgi:uncharacterized protein